MPGCPQSYVTGLAKHVAKYVKNKLKNTIPTKDLTQFDTLTSLQYLSAGGVEKIMQHPFLSLAQISYGKTECPSLVVSV